MEDKKKHSVSTVVAVVAAFVIGGAIAYPIGHNMANDDTSSSNSMAAVSTTTKASDLRTTMNNLLRDHVTTNLAVTYAIIDGNQTRLSAAEAAQTDNAVAIANAVGSIYGDQAKEAITTPFVNHLTESNNYAKAVKAGDTAAQQASLEKLRTSLREVATVFNSVIPSVPTDTLYDALNQHEELMNKVATQYQAGQYAAAFDTEQEALTQISGGADVLAKGIVASKPDAFKN